MSYEISRKILKRHGNILFLSLALYFLEFGVDGWSLGSYVASCEGREQSFRDTGTWFPGDSGARHQAGLL